MDSSQYNPTYAPWNSPYPPHASPAPPLPPPPPPPQSHHDSPNFYGQRQDYLHQYSHPAVNQPSLYYSQHPPQILQQHQSQSLQQQQQQQHPQYIPQIVSYEHQRISQPFSSSIQCTESRDFVGFKEQRHDSLGVGDVQSRIDAGQSRLDDGQSSNYQFDYSRSSRGSLGVGIYRSVDVRSRSRDEVRSLGYGRNESGGKRIEGNYPDRGQGKSESHRYFKDLDGNRVSSPSVGYGSERSRDMNRSSASHEGARNQRWDEARNGGRTPYPRRRDNDCQSQREKYFDRGRREESKESNRTPPRKQIQKKSALLRLENPRSHENSRKNDRSQQHNHHNGKRFNSNSYRGKEHMDHSDRGQLEKRRGESPVDLDVSFKSNVLVAKPVPSPTSADICSGTSVTPRSSKTRRTLLSDINEKASVTEGHRHMRTHLSHETLGSEVFRQSTKPTLASKIEKEPASDSVGKLNKDIFVDGVVQDSKVKISGTGRAASTHGSEAKLRSVIHAAETISSFCETSEEAKDEINAKYVSNLEVCSPEEDVIDGSQSILKSHEDVLDRTSTGCDVGEALMPKVMEKDETVKEKTKMSTSPVKTPVSLPTADEFSVCSEGGIHISGQPMHSVGSQHCEHEDMNCIPSKNLPVIDLNTAYEERNSVDSSVGPLGYGGKDFQKPSLDASIYLSGEELHVAAMGDETSRVKERQKEDSLDTLQERIMTSHELTQPGSQKEDENMDCIPSKNLPVMEVNTAYEERNSVDTSVGPLGYGGNNFQKPSLDASINFNGEEIPVTAMVDETNRVKESQKEDSLDNLQEQIMTSHESTKPDSQKEDEDMDCIPSKNLPVMEVNTAYEERNTIDSSVVPLGFGGKDFQKPSLDTSIFNGEESHVTAMVDETNRDKESQKEDSLDTLQEETVTSQELTQPGSSLAHCDLVMKPNGDPIKKQTDVTSDTGFQEKDSLNNAKTDIFDGEALASNGEEIHVAAMVDETKRVEESQKEDSLDTLQEKILTSHELTQPGSSLAQCDLVMKPYGDIIKKPTDVTSDTGSQEKDSLYSAKIDIFDGEALSSNGEEIHVAAMVDETNRGKESQEDSLNTTLQEQIMTSHELTQPGSSLAHCDSGMKPNGDLIRKPTDVTSDTGFQEKDSLKSAKNDIFDGEALSSDGKVSETEITGDSGIRVSKSCSHADVKIASTHVKDPLVIVLPRALQSKTSMSSKSETEKRKRKSSYPTQKTYPSSLPCVSDTKKDANPPVNITKNHTWHRVSDTSPSSFVAAKPLSFTLSTRQKFPKATAQSNSYVRKGNSLLRKPSHDSPGIALGMPPLPIPSNHLKVKDKNTESSSMVDVDNVSSLVKTGDIPNLERQTKTPSDSSISKVSNAIATSSGNCALSHRLDHLTTSLPESIMVSATSGEANFPHSIGDTIKTSDPLIQTSYTSDCQQKRNPPNLDSSNLKRTVYVKRKANQLVSASEINDVSKNQIAPSDSYFKRSKNQLVRNSESRVNESNSLPDDVLDTRSAANMVSQRSSSTAFSDSGVQRPFKRSKCSLVWTQNDPQPRMPTAHMRYQKILPQLLPWKRVVYSKRLMSSVSAFRNGSFPNISRKFSTMRKRHTVYTKSTNGYSLRKSKVLGIGGSHLKWSKSIERNSRKANAEATLAVAAFSKKEKEKHSGQNNTRTTCRNHLARERVFRVGSLRYKMDSSRRTLQRISDVDSPSSGPSENGKDVKRPFIPKRLVIDNEEYVRVGNGNQLVRDPKKRTRVLANEKVRWSLHNVRLRLAKKKKYCQFFTRFGKCNKDGGRCPYLHDTSKIAVCTKFLKGLCTNANCKLTHKVIPERMPDCSYFLQGLCNNESCPYRHVHVNPNAAICDGFLKGYCSDGDECRKKHSYICPVFEATGSCSQGSKCKLHHPKNQSKGRKRKRPSEPSQKNARGRYFGSLHNILSESEPMRRSTEKEVLGMEGLDFISLGITESEDGDDDKDPAMEQSISNDSESPFTIYNLIRPVALMQ